MMARYGYLQRYSKRSAPAKLRQHPLADDRHVADSLAVSPEIGGLWEGRYASLAQVRRGHSGGTVEEGLAVARDGITVNVRDCARTAWPSRGSCLRPVRDARP